MAGNKTNLFDGINNGAAWDAGVVFNRTKALPLDKFSVFPELGTADKEGSAQHYASNNPVAYIGQSIVVAGEDSVDMYLIIDEAGTLKKLATTTTSGDLASDVAKLQGDLAAVQGDIEAIVTEIENARNGKENLKASIDAMSVTVDTSSTTEGVSKSYKFSQNGKDLITIDIPKDMVVSSGTIETFTDENKPEGVDVAGTYIVLTIANKTNDKLYVNVSTLLDDKTIEGSEGEMITITTDTSEGPVKIEASIVDGSITEGKLATAITDKLALAVSAVQAIETGATNGTIKVDGVEVAVFGLGEAAYKNVTSSVTENSDALLTSGGAYTEIKNINDNLEEHNSNGDIHTSLAEKKLYYYGDPNIVITSAETFTYTVNDNEVSIDGLQGDTVTSIVIPYEIEGLPVTSIGDGAFWGYADLTSIIIPNSVRIIGGCAFQECSGLTSIAIPDSVTTIVDTTFFACDNLTTINIPNGVTIIGDSMFDGCSSLTSITIPDSVTTIDGAAFKGCTGLTSITIPDNVTTIGESAFEGCVALTIICEPGSSAETYAIENNIPHRYNSVKIVNDLTSTSEIDALSAAQGKILDEKIGEINTEITNLFPELMFKSDYDADSDGIVDKAADADKLNGQSADYYAIKEETYTKTEVNEAIATAIVDAEHLKREIVTELPTENIDDNTIYMIKKGSSETGDNYEEYMLIDDSLVKIGDTTVDLTDYLTKTGDASDTTITFTEAEEDKPELTTGDKISVLIGKIKKWFSSLHKVAFSGNYEDLENRIIEGTATMTTEEFTVDLATLYGADKTFVVYSVELEMDGEKVLGDIVYTNTNFTIKFTVAPSSEVKVKYLCKAN